MTKIIRVSGVYSNMRQIHLKDGHIIAWDYLNPETPPLIPYGTPLEITINFEERDYLNGTDGIIWATYDLHQAETVRSALLAQNISCELREQDLDGMQLFALGIPDIEDVQTAIDFVWRDKSGLCLQPDWSYPAGAVNASFKKWIDGM